MQLAILFIIYPFLCLGWGKIVFRLFSFSNISRPVLILIGLLVNNYLLLVLKCMHFSWIFSCLLVWLPAGLYLLCGIFKTSQTRFKMQWSWNLLLWSLVVLITGISLFDNNGGIVTPWISNYGDLTFHVGMITSFVFGDNFPPEYHIYPGKMLSYPFMINFWTASLWCLQSTWQALDYIFLYQWCFLWSFVFYFLNGKKHIFLPWTVFFAGGVYYGLNLPASDLIHAGLPWTGILETIWVPQRSALFGAVLLLGIVSEILKIQPTNKNYFAAGTIILFAPLVHTHFWMLSWGFVALFVLFNFRQSRVLSVFLLLSLLWLIYLGDKSGVIEKFFPYHWVMGEQAKNSVMGFFAFWLKNFWTVFLLLAVFYLKTKNHFAIFSIILLFIAGNIFKLSYWEFDQIKYFLALYILILIYWQKNIASNSYLNLLLVLLFIPGIYRTFNVFYQNKYEQVYSPKQLVEAAEIRKLTPTYAVIAARPDHNSTITLTGRRIFLGYPGTLWSHGIKYYEREKQNRNLLQRQQTGSVLPDYLYSPEPGRKYWNRQNSEMFDQFIEVRPFLYQLK